MHNPQHNKHEQIIVCHGKMLINAFKVPIREIQIWNMLKR